MTWLKPKALERFWGKVHCDQNLGAQKKKTFRILLCTTFKKYLGIKACIFFYFVGMNLMLISAGGKMCMV